MDRNLKLTIEEKKLFERFKDKISNRDECKLWNEDIIYLNYYIDSLLTENYAWAAHTWYVFLESFLRWILLFHRWELSWKKEEYILFLDKEEKILEEWECWSIISNQNEVVSSIRNFWFNDIDKQDEILENIKKYFDNVVVSKKKIRWQLSFNNICKELREYWLLESKEYKELRKFFTKYRNPLQHWLFKKLTDTKVSNNKMTIVSWWTWWIKTLEVDTSNLIIRELWIIETLLKDISMESYNIIVSYLYKFDKLKWNL